MEQLNGQTLVNILDYFNQTGTHKDFKSQCLKEIIKRDHRELHKHDFQLLLRSLDQKSINTPEVLTYIRTSLIERESLDSQTLINALNLIKKTDNPETQKALYEIISQKHIFLIKKGEFDFRQSYFILEELDKVDHPEIKETLIKKLTNNTLLGLEHLSKNHPLNGELVSIIINETIQHCSKETTNIFIEKLLTSIAENRLRLNDKYIFDLCITLNCEKIDDPGVIKTLLTQSHRLKSGERNNFYSGSEIRELFYFFHNHFKDHGELKSDPEIQKLLRHAIRSLDYTALSEMRRCRNIILLIYDWL